MVVVGARLAFCIPSFAGMTVGGWDGEIGETLVHGRWRCGCGVAGVGECWALGDQPVAPREGEGAVVVPIRPAG